MAAHPRMPPTSSRAPPAPRTNVLSTLKNTTMVAVTKPVLPAEILAMILDCLPIADLLRCARVSRRLREMVYEDARWVTRLRSMGVWDEAAARRAWEEHLRMRRAKTGREGIGVEEAMLFDAGMEEEQRLDNLRIRGMAQGVEAMSISDGGPANPEDALGVLARVLSVRGAARSEFGKIYGALAPFYRNLVQSQSHDEPILFRTYRTPEQQAQMLAQLARFARSDWAQGWRQRQERLVHMTNVFESAVLREFEQACEVNDVAGGMRRYVHVLNQLNGPHACIDIFMRKQTMFEDQTWSSSSLDCINQAASDAVALEPSRGFLERLSQQVNQHIATIDQVFPDGQQALLVLLDKVVDEILVAYVTPLFDEAHIRSIASYLKAVAGLLEQITQFAMTLKPTKESKGNFEDATKAMIVKVFESHADLYLHEELTYFKKEAARQVHEWETHMSEQEASAESFFMSNVTRQADKSDFLSSFKKVVMLPVSVLPFGVTKGSAASAAKSAQHTPGSQTPTRSTAPRLQSLGSQAISVPDDAPTDELTAKAALMASRLEGIRSLFSIEVALELTHAAKASIDRAALFVRLGAQIGDKAREQCQAIFVALLQILGDQHVKPGFDKAVSHLSKYNPRATSEHSQAVAPLATFLELVNVGDLIGQMIDVFYEQQLVFASLTDRNDFLDVAVKAKKRFEQMLDAAVAAGLGKGIDVLMDEVEYVCGTLQQPSDYNPPPQSAAELLKSPTAQSFEVGATPATQRIVEMVSTHTSMLRGSTDKTTLDIFNQEVGLRLFTALCKHLKRQRISVDGAMRLISDMNLYWAFVKTFKNAELDAYFRALRELSQIYLVDAKKHAKELAIIIADGARWQGIFRAEEVVEFAQRRADWYIVKRDVEKAMYGLDCLVM